MNNREITEYLKIAFQDLANLYFSDDENSERNQKVLGAVYEAMKDYKSKAYGNA